MLNRLRSLFHRYADRHLTLDLPGFPLDPEPTADRPQLGHVDLVAIRGNRVRVAGWSTADRITLRWQGGEDTRAPHIPREDVANALGLSRYTGFELEAPLEAFPYDLTVTCPGYQVDLPLSGLTIEAIHKARRKLRGQFLRKLVTISPMLLSYALRGSPELRDKIKRALALEVILEAGPMETALFTFGDGEQIDYPKDTPITIVMPVYNAFELTQLALERVVQNTDLPWHLVLVEDCSTDTAVRPWLKGWAKTQNADHPGRVTLLENATNLGFIGSVNKGFSTALERGHHVVLLNSDALVPDAWASRLLRPMVVHENVASVTPMTNDAEIFSSPVMCERSVLQPGEADAIDAVARSFHPEATLSVVPTGVGFCMAMHIDWLRKLPKLDTVFGRGYGEEVDWCQKVRAQGGRHLGLPGLYVEHRGGESFGSEEKQKLVWANNQIVSKRYPTYDREVQIFIAADPLITPRVALAVALVGTRAAAAKQAVPIYLAHSLGGGAHDDLERRIERDVEALGGVIVLRVGGPQRWQLEVVTEKGRVQGGTDSFEFIEALLAPVGARRLIYSCGVGDRDPATLPELFLSLRKFAMRDRIEILIHDYFPLSPSYCLLDSDNAYRGLPASDHQDTAHILSRPDGEVVNLVGWRAAWGRLINAAEHVTVFSEESRDLVLQVYPGAAKTLRVQPHSLLSKVPALTPPAPGARPVVGVLGNIGVQKGAKVVQDMALSLQEAPDMGMVLVGNIDPAYALPETVPVHGTYRVADLPQIVEKYGITCWLIPSVWPETFSFTTHEALATGFPVFAFYLGAQGGTVLAAENGHIMNFDPDANLAQIVLNSLRGKETPPVPQTDALATASE